jgi:short-subunit dehydrogenase
VPSNLALITGASKGIGRATAFALARQGMEVFITARSESQLQSITAEIQSNGISCSYFIADLGDINQISELAEHIKSKNKKISLLVHCAGVAYVAPLQKLPLAKWQKTLDINLTAPFYLTQKCLPLLEDGSRIIFINSIAGKTTFTDWSAYCVSKYGLKALADTMRQELQPRGIKVTSIYPASVDTPWHDQLGHDWDRTKMLNPDNVAAAIVSCYLQPQNVMIKEIDLENMAGTF